MFAKLLMPPSFYIWSSWLVVFLLYLIEPIELNPLSPEFFFVIFYVIGIALASNLLFKDVYFRRNTKIQIKSSSAMPMAFAVCTLIGFYGIYSYLAYVGQNLGGIGVLFALLAANPLEIRAIAIDELGGAVQLSYFSWLSIGIGTYLVRQRNYGIMLRLLVFVIVVIAFLCNMLFVDRTRPIWLIFIIAITWIALSKNPRKAMIKFVIYVPVSVTSLFIAFSVFTGKITQGGLIETLSLYILSGFAYSNYILTEFTSVNYVPIRTFYPISKVLEVVGLGGVVPSQVLEFYEVPFPTNVGGFVEPLIGDGGLIFVLLGVPIIVIATDWLGFAALQSRTYLGVFLYANLIFSNMFAFFVSKFSSTPIYLFVTLFLISRVLAMASKQGALRQIPLRSRQLRASD